MANLKSILRPDYDANAAAESGGTFDGAPLPPGLYTVEITDADVKDLKSGNGTGLSIEFTVIDPEQHARRKVWTNLNIRHTNATAQEIGERDLALMCRAIGIGIPADTDELVGRVLRIRTKIRAAQGDYAARAEVAGYEAAGSSHPAQRAAPTQRAAAAPAPAAAPAAPTASTPPWKRRAA
jgi:hypothetical protein